MQKNSIFSNEKKSNLVENASGGKGYKHSAELTLARIIGGGFIGNSFYTEATEQLKIIKELAEQVSPEFLSAAAIYNHQKGFMKDTPALLLALLRNKNVDLYKKTFDKVVTSGRMLRGFVNMIRSGQAGSKNLGYATRKLIQKWLDNRTPLKLL